MNLANFESLIEDKIVDRGRDYYLNDYIEEIEKVGKYEYSATIFGSEEYTTHATVSALGEIIESGCSCPYDWGNHCKHEVALFFYLRNAQKKGQLDKISGNTFTELSDELERHSKAELVKIILAMAKRDKELKEELLWELGLRG